MARRAGRSHRILSDMIADRFCDGNTGESGCVREMNEKYEGRDDVAEEKACES